MLLALCMGDNLRTLGLQFSRMRVLCIRLSALGDVVLATSALEYISKETQVHWLTSKSLAPVLKGHPKISKLWCFDSQLGLRGWLALGKELHFQDYDVVYDLHSSLRSQILRAQFLLLNFLRGSRRAKPEWRSIKKSRWRLVGYQLFKKLWPKDFYPIHFLKRIKNTIDSSSEKILFPNFSYQKHSSQQHANQQHANQQTSPIAESNYYCVMPSSKWRGKEWSAEKFRELIEFLPGVPVILGQNSDLNSVALAKLLDFSGIKYHSAIGKFGLSELPQVLAHSRFLIAVDTGMAHWAQALNVPSVVIFGPTDEHLGYGPWAEDSSAVGIDLFCRPCGKYGNRCYRVWQRYECLNGLSVSNLLTEIRQKISNLGGVVTSPEVPEYPKF